jgi:biotin carboxylase
MKRILYIGGGREAQESLVKARDLGLEVVYIQRKRQFKDALLPYVDHVVLIDYGAIDVLIPVARTLHSLFPFVRAISLSEDALVPTAHVRDALGLPGNSLYTVRLLKDKWRMRQHLNARGFSPVAAAMAQSPADVTAFVREHGVPIILKPNDASGSLGIFRVDDVAQIDAVWPRIEALGLSSALMEEYLDGPEISVESVTFAGRHVVLAITDKLKMSNFVEIGHSIPAQLDGKTYQQVIELVTQFLDVVQLAEGPAHTEIKLTSRGPRIIESHNRPGGDRINELVRVAFGVDMKRIALGWPCGLVEPLEVAPRLESGAAVRFFTPTPGVIREVSGLDAVRDAEGVVELYLGVEVGDRVHPVTESYDRVGWVVCRGATALEANRRCENVLRTVRIITG